MLIILSLMMDYDPNNGRELVPLAPRALEYIVQHGTTISRTWGVHLLFQVMIPLCEMSPDGGGRVCIGSTAPLPHPTWVRKLGGRLLPHRGGLPPYLLTFCEYYYFFNLGKSAPGGVRA